MQGRRGCVWKQAVGQGGSSFLTEPTVACEGKIASAREASRLLAALALFPGPKGKSSALTPPLAAAWWSSQATFGPQKGSSMSPRPFAPRRRRSLIALDYGLAVRVDAHPLQRTIFSGAENLSVQELTSELSEMISGVRVRSFALRAELEDAASALLLNVQCGFWALAERAALDLGGLLEFGRKRRFTDPELCVRGARCAQRIADLCAQEVR